MRFRLRTLLIVLGLAPPALAGAWWWVWRQPELAGIAGFVVLYLVAAVLPALIFAEILRRRRPRD